MQSKPYRDAAKAALQPHFNKVSDRANATFNDNDLSGARIIFNDDYLDRTNYAGGAVKWTYEMIIRLYADGPDPQSALDNLVDLAKSKLKAAAWPSGTRVKFAQTASGEYDDDSQYAYRDLPLNLIFETTE